MRTIQVKRRLPTVCHVSNLNIFGILVRRIWTNVAHHILPQPPHLKLRFLTQVSDFTVYWRNGRSTSQTIKSHPAMDQLLLLHEHVLQRTQFPSFMLYFNNGRRYIAQDMVFWRLRFRADTSQYSHPPQTQQQPHTRQPTADIHTQAQCFSNHGYQMNAISKICQIHIRSVERQKRISKSPQATYIQAFVKLEFSQISTWESGVPSAFCSGCNHLPKQLAHLPSRLTKYVPKSTDIW